MVHTSAFSYYLIFSTISISLSFTVLLVSPVNSSPVHGVTVKVSIVPGAISMGDRAFTPNPVNIKVGDTVTWTNNDDIFHTVTSGQGSDDTNLGKEFDSGLSGPTALISQGRTFSHTFVGEGEFQYFCQLHSTMIGKIVVAK